MNRLKKYDLQKQIEKRWGLVTAEIEKLDQTEQKEMDFWRTVAKFHKSDWDEEYDFLFDSNADVRDRVAGNNPMNKDYIARVEEKRFEQGVSQLAPNGLPNLGDDTWRIACIKALRERE